FLVGVRSEGDLGNSPLRGALWETLVYSELRRAGLHRRGGSEIHLWRDRTKEADFLLHRGGRFDLADAKWTAHPDRKDAAALARVAADLPRGRTRRRAIFCRTPNPYPIDERTEALPLSAAAEWVS
ncbi:MAG: DUF4143 domain-containing protein, partial [Deltaproteobacteria bacterium]|nr:DUF4143 domain-containing protein [Deltaproteobacteria bacterium]